MKSALIATALLCSSIVVSGCRDSGTVETEDTGLGDIEVEFSDPGLPVEVRGVWHDACEPLRLYEGDYFYREELQVFEHSFISRHMSYYDPLCTQAKEEVNKPGLRYSIVVHEDLQPTSHGLAHKVDTQGIRSVFGPLEVVSESPSDVQYDIWLVMDNVLYMGDFGDDPLAGTSEDYRPTEIDTVNYVYFRGN